MTQGLGIVANIKSLKAVKYFAVSLIISSSISITASAQPEDAEIMNSAAQLGLLQAALSHNIQHAVLCRSWIIIGSLSENSLQQFRIMVIL